MRGSKVPGNPDAPTVLFYCHEGLGIGHVKRALTLGRYLRTRWPAMSQVLVASTDNPGLTLADGVEYIKLPSLNRVGPDEADEPYVPRALPISFPALRDMRADILLSVVRHCQPDILLVDYWPAGVKGELMPALRYLQQTSPRTRFVLGLRDIVDEASRLRHTWQVDAVYDLLDQLYDRILVYGQQDIYDLVRAAGLSARAAAKTRHTGYLRRSPGTSAPEQLRAGLRTGRLVLITVGGGADGFPVLSTALEAIRRRPAAQFDCLLVAGPLMPLADRGRLRTLVPADPTVRFVDSVDDLASYVSIADVVVARAGYNTVCEILSFGRPAILIPRVPQTGRDQMYEQLLRAEAVSRRGLATMIHPDDFSPIRLLEAVEDLLEQPPQPRAPVSLDGLPTVASELEALLTSPDA